MSLWNNINYNTNPFIKSTIIFNTLIDLPTVESKHIIDILLVLTTNMFELFLCINYKLWQITKQISVLIFKQNINNAFMQHQLLILNSIYLAALTCDYCIFQTAFTFPWRCHHHHQHKSTHTCAQTHSPRYL